MATRFVEAFVLIGTVDSLQVVMILCHPLEFVGYNLRAPEVEQLEGISSNEKILVINNNNAGVELFSRCPGTQPSSNQYSASTYSQQHPAAQ